MGSMRFSAAPLAVGAGEDVDTEAAAEKLGPWDLGTYASALLGFHAGSFLSFAFLLVRALGAVRRKLRPAATGRGAAMMALRRRGRSWGRRRG